MTTIAICTIGNAMSREQREALAEDMRTQLRSKVEPLVLTVPVGVKLEFAEVGHFGENKTATKTKTTAAKELDTLVEEFINTPVLSPGRTRVDVMAEIQAVAERVTSEAPPKTSIGEFTVKLDTSLVHDTIREMLEPGAMYLPASAVEKLKRFGYINEAKLVEFGGITAKKPDEGNNS